MNHRKIAGKAYTPKARRLTWYRPFKVLTVNTATVSEVTGSCQYTRAKPRVLKTMPPCSWLKASSTIGSGYAGYAAVTDFCVHSAAVLAAQTQLTSIRASSTQNPGSAQGCLAFQASQARL